MSTGPRDNDFTIKIANVNGTGSASANALLMKTFFRMGIPVVGKNYFPSNIQGLPTWYEIRVNGDGHLARSGRVDLMVAMNAETYQKDLNELSSGGYLVYDSTWPRHKTAPARRHQHHWRSAVEDVQRELRYGTFTRADEKRRLRRRNRGPARPRHGH